MSKGNVVLVARILRKFRVEVHHVSCIVSNPPEHNSALVNPANSELIGCISQPYFPIGGPVPPKIPRELRNTSWGGLEVGENMLYASQTVDGHVSELGGHSLRKEVEKLPVLQQVRAVTGGSVRNVRCLDGQAVITVATEGLAHNFKHVIHTVPPFVKDREWQLTLQQCYHSVLDIALSSDMEAVACPLLGSGCRGIPQIDAVAAAVEALSTYFINGSMHQEYGNHATLMADGADVLVLRFGVIDDGLIPLFQRAFDESSVWEISHPTPH